MHDKKGPKRSNAAESAGQVLFDLLSGTSDGVFAVDRGQRVAFWNAAAQRILGFEGDAVLGRPCYEVLGGADESGCAVCERRCAIFSTSLRGEASATREVLVRSGDGGRKRATVTTFVLPSSHHDLFLLTHVLREANEATEIPARLKQVLEELEVPNSSAADPRPQPGSLTRRELEVLQLLATGASTPTLCARLRVERTTVRTHVQRILDKFGVHSRLEAVALASRIGLLRPRDD